MKTCRHLKHFRMGSVTNGPPNGHQPWAVLCEDCVWLAVQALERNMPACTSQDYDLLQGRTRQLLEDLA